MFFFPASLVSCFFNFFPFFFADLSFDFAAAFFWVPSVAVSTKDASIESVALEVTLTELSSEIASSVDASAGSFSAKVMESLSLPEADKMSSEIEASVCISVSGSGGATEEATSGKGSSNDKLTFLCKLIMKNLLC